MTFAQMLAETELLYESINSSAAPGFTTTEWGQIFTVAQRTVVRKILEEGVTRDSFNMLAIEKLIRSDSYISFTTDSYFKNSIGGLAQALDITVKAFDTMFFWVLDEYIETGVDATLVTNIPIKRISFDFYRINIDNPFRAPNTDEGYWLLQYNNIPIFITDGTAITKYCVVGVHHPDNYPIGVTYGYPAVGGEASCLNKGVHSKIVEEAVTLARMSVIDAPGYQLSMTEFNK
jgi:hypothetical protein